MKTTAELLKEARELLHNALLIRQFGSDDPHIPMNQRTWDSAAEAFLRGES